jgi:hypothetical protein
MAGYKSTFGGNVDYAYSRGVTDLTGRLQNGASQLMGAGKGVAAFASQANTARQSIKGFSSDMAELKKQISQTTDPRKIAQLTRQFESARRSAEGLRKSLSQMPFDAMEKGLGNVTKGLISFNINILKMGFDFLIDSIKRVYELQERWTHAIGGFNMKIGGMTKGIAGATKAAVQWSSTIRGLTNGSIEEGIQMFGDFTMAIGRTVEAGDGFAKLGLQMARGFGIGGQGAGQILKVFENIGMSAEDAGEAMKTSIKSANAAGIPVNMLADDLVKSITYMARFGKEGQKTLIQGAAWARKYDIALEDLKRSVEGFDMFDDAAKSASKLNTAFGTLINSMDLMMEDDPAKRLEMIRQQMLNQGMTYDKLTPKQRRYFSETLKLSEEQTAALLDARNAGESYADFQAKAEQKQKDELSAKQMMQKMLVKTAQTMFAFGAAFDRVTVAIGHAIKPLLEVFGLADDGTKKFDRFGKVMNSTTDVVVDFFEQLAEPGSKFQDFMKELANDLKRAASGLKDFVMDGRAADLMGDIAQGMKSFYVWARDLAIKVAPAMRPLLDAFLFLSKHLDKIVIAYGALKGFGAIKNLAGAVGMGPSTGLLRGGAKAGLGALVGGGAGMLMGGTGASIGGMVGGLLGPIGGLIGAVGGKLIEKIADWFSEGKSDLEVAKEKLEEQIKRETSIRETLVGMVELGTRNQQAEDRIRKSRNDVLRAMEQAAAKQTDKKLTLGDAEIEMFRARGNELAMFGKTSKEARRLLDGLGVGSQLTQKQLGMLLDGAKAYEDELSKLRDATKAQADLELSRLQISNVGQQKEAGEALKALREQELKSLKTELETLGGPAKLRDMDMAKMMLKDIEKGTNVSRSNVGLLGDEQQRAAAKKTIEGELKKLEIEAKINKLDMANTKAQGDLLKTQTEYLREQTKIQLKQLVTSSGDYLNFMNAAEQKGMGPQDIFNRYMASNADKIISDVSQAGFDLLKEGPNLANIKAATAPTVTPKTDTYSAVPTGGFTLQPTGGPMSSTTNVNFTAVLEVDGKPLAKSMGSSLIQSQ